MFNLVISRCIIQETGMPSDDISDLVQPHTKL